MRRVALFAAVIAVLTTAAPTPAEHLTLEPGARPSSAPSPRPADPYGLPDAGMTMRMDRDGFHVGGRMFGFGASLDGRMRERGFTLDGRLDGQRPHRFRFEADTPPGGWPRLRLEMGPAVGPSL